MRVIVLHHEQGDSIAIVAESALLVDQEYTEIDQEDSAGVLRGNPDLQLHLQSIFSDVMEMFGFKIAPSQKAENDA